MARPIKWGTLGTSIRILATLVTALCVASPSHAQTTPTACVFVGNLGSTSMPGGWINSFSATSAGVLTNLGAYGASGGVKAVRVRGRTLLALTNDTLLSFDIGRTNCTLTQRSAMMLTSGTFDMTVSVSGDIVYVTSDPNTVSIVPIDPSGTLSPPFIAPPLPGSAVLDLRTIVAAAPAVYARGNRFCGYSVYAGGLLAAPICVAQAHPSTRGSLLVAGNVLYSLILDSVDPRLQAFFIAPTNGDLQWIDANPATSVFDDIPLGGFPLTMAASPDGSVVYAAYHGGIASITAPTATHPHSILSSSGTVANGVALAVDPAGNVVYATDPAQGLVFSVEESNGVFFYPTRYSFVSLGAYPGSIAAAPYTPRQPPHWPP